jgi:hypothetical protein
MKSDSVYAVLCKFVPQYPFTDSQLGCGLHLHSSIVCESLFQQAPFKLSHSGTQGLVRIFRSVLPGYFRGQILRLDNVGTT